MALSNKDRVTRALECLVEGLYDLVDDTMTREYGSDDWNELWANELAARTGSYLQALKKDDVQTLLRAITERGVLFKDVLSRSQQAFASELREVRNSWAHDGSFSSDDALRALDTAERLLLAVDATAQAAELRKSREELARSVSEGQIRNAKRYHVDVPSGAGLKPWREVILPHDDITAGNYNASQYAANLYDVANGNPTSVEYSNPIEFFDRTYVTEGLSDLLARAVRRMSGDMNASPVVNLQTNFGGGKTHSLLALYHLFGGTPNSRLPQEVQEIIARCGDPEVSQLKVRRVVLVGNYLKPAEPSVKPDGTRVFTMWGELAWQLGGREAFDIVAEADRSGTSPGSALLELITRFSPCLILIDEWVAFARQLVGKNEPAGSFETQFTFAQTLTDVVSSVPGAMLVVSIPVSEFSTPETAGNDLEIGGDDGQLALARLQNVIGRSDDQWRPSRKDESFEIVKRRLFKDPDPESQSSILVTARLFAEMYQDPKYSTSFPREATALGGDYERRIIASYPLHPELFDRLYEDWSTLERFQRTRGVLRLVSCIVQALWESEDSSPLIMPGSVQLAYPTVNSELTKYLEDAWKPIIDADIDGPDSIAEDVDKSTQSLGSRHIARRIARTVFMGAAPRAHSANLGLDRQSVWLGTAMPGDPLGSFSIALEKLAQNSSFFYTESDRYWYDTHASIAKAAREMAEHVREDPELAYNEIVRRLNEMGRARASFDRVHVAPESGADIPDFESTRLVIVHPRYTYRRTQADETAPLLTWLRRAIELRDGGQRLNRNTLVFMMAEGASTEGLLSAVREYLGWVYVSQSGVALDLTTQQMEQAKARMAEVDRLVQQRLEAAYVWAAYPAQENPALPFTIEFTRLSESEGGSLAGRAEAKLRREEQLIFDFAPSSIGYTLGRELAGVWAGGELSVGELWSYFIQYPYMPRLLGRSVLDRSVEAALTAIGFETLVNDRFALASGKDLESGQYLNLILPPDASAVLQVTDNTLLVGWDKALAQREAAAEALADASDTVGYVDRATCDIVFEPDVVSNPGFAPVVVDRQDLLARTRYFGSVRINSSLYAKDLATIGREVLDLLIASGAKLELSLEINADKPDGFSESEIRTILENTNNLEFDESGFEEG